jgi:hypothetical protein
MLTMQAALVSKPRRLVLPFLQRFGLRGNGSHRRNAA